MSSSLLSSRRIDAVCGQFESAWRSGRRASIESLVAAAEPEDRPGLLAELVVLEFELRAFAGEPACIEEYLARFPGDEQLVRAALAPSDVPVAPRRGENREARPAAEGYQLGEQVGRGGMGVVLSAHDRQLDRELAVKLLAEPLQTRREARDDRPVPTGEQSAAPDHDSLAPLPDASAAWTFLGDVVGTPQYMSPEQARGDADAIDQRADVFALGAMLAEILTGSPPYSAGEPNTRLEQAQQGDLAVTLARLDACSADRELIELARDCLAVQRADRPPDAGHVSLRMTAFRRSVQQRLQRLELERVEARTRAEERRRRRRIVLTLAAGLMLLAVLLAAGTTWIARREAARQRDEAARREQIRRQLTETLDEAQQLYAQTPEDWRQDPLRRTRIRELAHRAETLTESPWSEPTLAGAVRTLHDRIRAEDADGRLLDSLEQVRLRRAEANPRTNKFASGRTRPMYRKAFADYGLDPATIEAPQAAARIKSRPAHVVEACIFGLDSWRSLFKLNADPSPWIDAVLDGIDQNRWRGAVRQGCRERDWATVGELLAAGQDPPLSADVVNLVAMKLMDARQFDLALQLLRAAQPNHPGDFWINQNLGLVYYVLPDRRLDESVRFFTAALAIWETGAAYLNLGAALFDLHRYSEAEQAYRAALRLQPDYAQAHFCLSETLSELNRVEEALASVEQALAIVPDMPEALALRDQLSASAGKRKAGEDASTDGGRDAKSGSDRSR
jgi:serine/threonine-protein kinase